MSLQSLCRCTLFCMLAVVVPTVSWGFAEDACPGRQGGWNNCPTQLCPQSLAETGNLVCETLSMATNIVGQQAGGTGRRSTLHMDATYYMAQAVGFTPRQAFQIAIYDQAADLGAVDFYDENGRALITQAECDGVPEAPESCQLLAKPMSGIDRNNFAGGGVNFHFMAPQVGFGQPIPELDGFSPDLSNPLDEHFLVHVRRWAFGDSPLLCVGGITNQSEQGDYASGASCFTGATGAYLGEIPFVAETAPLTTVSWVSPMGEQLININNPTIAAHELPEYVGEDVAPLVKLGVYVHAVADRVSHQLCVRSSYLEGPRPEDAPTIFTLPIPYDVWVLLQYNSDPEYLIEQMLASPIATNPDFLLKFDDNECDQPSHANRHTFEVGYAQDTLQPDHQTLEPGLRVVYQELLAYAKRNGFARPVAANTEYRESILKALVSIMEDAEAQGRLDGMTALAAAQDWLPLPGFGGLSFESWDTRAGELKLAREVSAARTTPATTGSGALSLLLLLVACAFAGHRNHA